MGWMASLAMLYSLKILNELGGHSCAVAQLCGGIEYRFFNSSQVLKNSSRLGHYPTSLQATRDYHLITAGSLDLLGQPSACFRSVNVSRLFADAPSPSLKQIWHSGSIDEGSRIPSRELVAHESNMSLLLPACIVPQADDRLLFTSN